MAGKAKKAGTKNSKPYDKISEKNNEKQPHDKAKEGAKIYVKKYNVEWEKVPQLKGWVKRNPDPQAEALNQTAYCDFCNKALRGYRTDLVEHAERDCHKKAARSKACERVLEEASIPDKIKTAELDLAVHIACHSAVRAVDHLTDVIVKNATDKENPDKRSHLADITLKRTKCSALIKKVIAPALLEEVVEDIGDGPYGLLVDESTDIGAEKQLALCIRYFSKKLKSMHTDFLGIVTVADGSAVSLFNAVIEYCKKIKLRIENLFSLGTDGASAMVGKNHSLYTLFRDHIKKPGKPDLILMRCLCHSIANASSNASKELPCDLEFLVRESKSWFSHSTKRMGEYKETFQLININEEKKMLQLLKLSDTRWLSWGACVRRILDQWLELKQFFGMYQETTAIKLAELYNDPSNHLYLLFLNSILFDVDIVNTKFQKADDDWYSLYESLWRLILSTITRFAKPLLLKLRNNNV